MLATAAAGSWCAPKLKPERRCVLQEASADNVTLPFAIVVASAEDGTGIQELQASTQQMLAQQHAARRKVAARVASNHGLDW